MNAQRRTRLRLGARDLAATAAFASMAVSGELPVWVLVLFGAGVVTALLNRRVLAKVGVVSGLALAAGAAGLYANVALGAVDLVVAAGCFAALITLHRMLSAPHPRTDQQVMLTSLLMISGGAALSGELFFGVALAFFAALATVALGLGVVEQTLPLGADFAATPLLRRLGVGVVFALVGAMAFFLFIPRLSWNMAARRTSPGLGATTGLADGVRLGQTGGSIKSNPRVVARVELNPDPRSETLDAYWQARTYSRWSGTEWTAEQKALPGRMQVKLRAGARTLLHQRIELLPAYGAHAALAQVEPVLIGNATSHKGNAHVRTQLLEFPGYEVRFVDPGDSYSYHAYSAAQDDGEENPDARLSPPERQAYLSLPSELDPRIADLAARVLEGERDPAKAAAKLARYLKQGYAYTLELPDRADDPLADFLFDRKAGHCEYFATALSVLLRTQGIPTRLATGFFGGERAGDVYLIRAGDAHAWTQVWVPGRGFVNFDATPEAGRAAQPSRWLEWVMRAYEELDELWRGRVLEFSLRDQAAFAFKVFDVSKNAPRKLHLPGRQAWIAAGLVALLVYAVWRVRLLRRERAPRSDATRMREQAEALLKAAGVPPGEPLEELARRLEAQAHPLSVPVRRITRRYVEARFGAAPLRPGEARKLLQPLSRARHP